MIFCVCLDRTVERRRHSDKCSVHYQGNVLSETGSSACLKDFEDKCRILLFVLLQVELLAAKNLIGADLNGTSDPYAILNCGSEKRFRFFFIKKIFSFSFC